jgi:predicted phosphoribosyltransferase
MRPFADRRAAGRALAERVGDAVSGDSVVVLGLPRGGVVVAAQIAERLAAPLDVLVARKLRTPGRPEFAMGAVAVWGRYSATVRNEEILAHVGVPPDAVETEQARELAAARERAARWNEIDPDGGPYDVVLVDDGLATGATMQAATRAARQAGVRRLVVAVPVGAPDELTRIAEQVDALVSLAAPRRFGAVGAFYEDFREVDDATVADELARARQRQRSA